MGRVSQRYRENVISGAISADPAQQALLPKLDALLEALERPVRRGFFGRTKASAVKGLYIWGGVGGGKSYLMDLFANSLAVAVRRVFKAMRLWFRPTWPLCGPTEQSGPLL